jgi:hypothetical protein
MLRQLLTLLAVISGFTLAAEPVAAAQGAVVSVASADAQTDCAPIANAPLQMAEARQANRAQQALPYPARPAIVSVPTVYLQADRARE